MEPKFVLYSMSLYGKTKVYNDGCKYKVVFIKNPICQCIISSNIVRKCFL